MSQIINQTDEYNTVTENELSVILASFETQFIYSVIQDNLNAKYSTNFIGVERHNVVRSFEDSFKNLLNTYQIVKNATLRYLLIRHEEMPTISECLVFMIVCLMSST